MSRRRKGSRGAVSSPIGLQELTDAITAAGGGANALDSAAELLSKVRSVEAHAGCRSLLDQLLTARESGDFRGRVLEINVAARFLDRGVALQAAVKQGRPGDIDLQFDLCGKTCYLELKHLGEEKSLRRSVADQLAESGCYSVRQDGDLGDIARLQRDLIGKASLQKFDPTPRPDAINLIGIDVSELQLGTIDLADCLLAAAGNQGVANHCHASCLRETVVGVFEEPDPRSISEAQNLWMTGVHRIVDDTPHPRDYIHGALFLFRKPAETAALSYDLKSMLVWNSRIVTEDIAGKLSSKLHEVIPFAF